MDVGFGLGLGLKVEGIGFRVKGVGFRRLGLHWTKSLASADM